MFGYSGEPVGLSYYGYALYPELYRNKVFEQSFHKHGMLYTDVDQLYTMPDNMFHVNRAFGNFAFILYVPNYVPRHVAITQHRLRMSKGANTVYTHRDSVYTGMNVDYKK